MSREAACPHASGKGAHGSAAFGSGGTPIPAVDSFADNPSPALAAGVVAHLAAYETCHRLRNGGGGQVGAAARAGIAFMKMLEVHYVERTAFRANDRTLAGRPTPSAQGIA